MIDRMHEDARPGIPWRPIGWGSAALLLAAPAVAMLVTDEVAWSPGDFIAAAVLLLAVGATIELAARRPAAPAYRYGVAVACLGALLTIWINGAVGVIGSEDDGANMLFLGVLGIAFLGSGLVRFRPAGMKRVFYVTAAAQLLVGAVAVIGRLGAYSPDWPKDVIGATAMFAALWLLAAWLFRAAADR